jgi:hypothetical protein
MLGSTHLIILGLQGRWQIGQQQKGTELTRDGDGARQLCPQMIY